MEDLIKRSDAIKALYKYSFVSKDVIEREINATPSADRPSGEWVEDPINENIRQCSNCKASYTNDFLKSMTLYTEQKEVPNYCPHCGARMKGADDEML